MANTKSKAVAKTAQSEVPADFEEQFIADSEEFQQNVRADDMAMPFIQILQALSPQVTEGHALFMEDAKKGQFFNTATEDLIDGKEGLLFVPVTYKRSYIEWVTRTEGGGFVAEFPYEDGPQIKTERNDRGEDIIIEGSPLGVPGHQMVDTITMFGLIPDLDTGDTEPVILSFYITQMKVARKLISRLQQRRVLVQGAKRPAPWFWDLWKVNTVLNTNDQGSWYGFNFSNEGELQSLKEVGGKIYKAAGDFFRMIKRGEANADYSKMSPAEEGGQAAGEGGPEQDDEIPF